jgi:hypothetical protein
VKSRFIRNDGSTTTWSREAFKRGDVFIQASPGSAEDCSALW